MKINLDKIEKNLEAYQAFIKENTTSEHRQKRWGLTLDKEENRKKFPREFIDEIGVELDHAQIKRFFMMSDAEKFLWAYWSQRNIARKSFVWGMYGLIFFIVIILIIFGNLFF